MASVLLSALLSASLAFSWSASRQAPTPLPQVGVGAPLHPLFVRDLSDASNPLLGRLEAHLGVLRTAGTTGESAAGYLRGLSPSDPVDQTAVGVLARVLGEPDGALRLSAAHQGLPEALVEELSGLSLSTRGFLGRFRMARGFVGRFSPPHPALAELARGALEDPLVSAVFDGAPSLEHLELDGLAYGEGVLYGRSGAIPPLGKGYFGQVYRHPAIEGAILKMGHRTTDPTVEFDLDDWADPLRTRFDPDDVADKEEKVAVELSRVGAGPRHFGRALLNGHHARVGERVYGETLRDLVLGRRFTDEEFRLFKDLMEVLARARLHPGDLRLANIMIGGTLLDASRRALVVDGGWLEHVPEDLSLSDMRHRLRWAMTPIESDEPNPNPGSKSSQFLYEVLEKGLELSQGGPAESE